MSSKKGEKYLNDGLLTKITCCGEQSDLLVSLISTGLGRKTVEQLFLLIIYTNFADEGLQAWHERLPKKGVLQWLDSLDLMAEQNLEGHGAQSEIFCFIIYEMNIKVNTLEYDNEINKVYASHI